MTSAILLAGYNNRRAVARYARVVERDYGETFVETGYKPLRRFAATDASGETVEKPLIQFTLERLLESREVSDIVIVGHRMLLERALGAFVARFDTPCTFVSQNAKLSRRIVELFGIDAREVRHDSLAGNAIKAYTASLAGAEQRHALFVAADSPLTTREFIERALALGRQHEAEHAIIVPAALIEGERDRLGRLPLKLVNDTGLLSSAPADSRGRQGFRLTSLLYANPFALDVNTTNVAYSLRKGLSPSVQLRVLRITRSLGYENIYSKYFIRGDLRVSEVEDIASAFFRGRVKIVPVADVAATYDYDGTDRELRGIGAMLRDKPAGT